MNVVSSAVVLGDELRWTVGGLVCGLAGAAAAARALRSLLFHVSPEEPSVYAMACVVLATLAMAFLPSRRAARVDPASTLRQD
jgi:putative ABC transport system permease protein